MDSAVMLSEAFKAQEMLMHDMKGIFEMQSSMLAQMFKSMERAVVATSQHRMDSLYSAVQRAAAEGAEKGVERLGTQAAGQAGGTAAVQAVTLTNTGATSDSKTAQPVAQVAPLEVEASAGGMSTEGKDQVGKQSKGRGKKKKEKKKGSACVIS